MPRRVLATALTARAIRGRKAATAAAAASQTSAPTGGSEVRGQVTYRERMTLAPTSMLKVALEDVSRLDAPATVLTEQTRALGPANPPYAFALACDPGMIRPDRSYAVRAEIRDPDGKLKLTTVTRYPVLTQGAPNEVEIVLQAAN
ncbi:YbaY family lipoprotein [Caulobacter sp. 17J65-9]|uniref:YbaY family lipoprotein n=1 Tax=Caulobacter sp. 17J65-9 TaxID=2709382 RepID=UPI0013C55E6D|nr:YbaY family lipoprotein [Caulobacter sp. 17J65-9]NEX92121.1 hypothetical protein [Caulobacter sp. 17J65-9]